MEEHEKENEVRLRRRQKKQGGPSKAPHTWYNYLENKKLEEAQERKNARKIFLHVVEGVYVTWLVNTLITKWASADCK